MLAARKARERLGAPDLFITPGEALRRLASRLPMPACLHDGRSGWVLVSAAPVDERRVHAPADPFKSLADLLGSSEDRDTASPGDPGWLGLITYESGRVIENLPGRLCEEPAPPRLWLGRYPSAAWWHPNHGMMVDGEEEHARSLLGALGSPLSTGEHEALRGQPIGAPVLEMDRSEYDRAFQVILDAIQRGDVYQVNLTTCLRGRWSGHPLSFHERLTGREPPAWAAYLDLGETVISSASPELLLAFEASTRTILSAPIKGTVPRGSDAKQDAAQIESLVTSEKDRAEHVMIVDLVRNDLGRVSTSGTVSASPFMETMTLPNIHHLVTEVRGELASGQSPLDLLRALFPGGSITGAPKIAAMKYIDLLEAAPRGVYCGAIGRFSTAGDLLLSLPIRTATLSGSDRDWTVRYGAGGGLVADSRVEMEYEELLLKAGRAIEVLSA